jgi:hypothetical protein
MSLGSITPLRWAHTKLVLEATLCGPSYALLDSPFAFDRRFAAEQKRRISGVGHDDHDDSVFEDADDGGRSMSSGNNCAFGRWSHHQAACRGDSLINPVLPEITTAALLLLRSPGHDPWTWMARVWQLPSLAQIVTSERRESCMRKYPLPFNVDSALSKSEQNREAPCVIRVDL